MSTKKMIATVAAFAAVTSLSIDEVENQQGRQVTVVVTETPTGLESSGQPIQNARVEYVEDGADDSTAIASTTVQRANSNCNCSGLFCVTVRYTQARCCSVSLGGRPGIGNARSASIPPARYLFSQS